MSQRELCNSVDGKVSPTAIAKAAALLDKSVNEVRNTLNLM